MRRISAVFLCLLLLAGLPPAALAAPVGADYDVLVTPEDNIGLNMREGPSSAYDKVREDPIPMYALLHITQVDVDEKGREWGYTSYTENGVTDTGWVFLPQTTRTEASGGGGSDPSSSGITVGLSGGEAAAALDPAQAAAYLSVLKELGTAYGFCPASNDPYRSNPEEKSGLAFARLLDFDGDGSMELYLYYILSREAPDDEGYDRLEEEIWLWNGATANRVHSEEFYASWGTSYGAYRYLLPENGRILLGSDNFYVRQRIGGTDMTLLQLQGGQVTEYRSAWDMWDNNTPEGDYSATLDGQELSPIDPVLRTDTDFTNIIDRRVKEFYDTYSPGKGEVLVEGGDLLWKSSEVDSLMALLADRAVADSRGTDALAGVPYYGDRSTCRMDGRMAAAYGRALSAQPKESEWGARLYAALVDVSGDGYPLLLTAYRYPEARWGLGNCSGAQIWEVRDGEAVPYDFAGDSGSFDDTAGTFSLITVRSTGVLRANSNGGGAVNPLQGDLFYRASGGRLKLVATLVENTEDGTYTLDGRAVDSREAAWERLGVEGEETELTANGSDYFLEADTVSATTAAAALEAYAAAAPEMPEKEEARPDRADPEEDEEYERKDSRDRDEKEGEEEDGESRPAGDGGLPTAVVAAIAGGGGAVVAGGAVWLLFGRKKRS